jgi:hypothetical protein
MTRLHLIRVALTALSIASVPALHAQTAADSAAIRAAALDYIEGFYLGDSTRHIRSIRPEVMKTGFSADRNTGTYRQSSMPWREFHAYANRIKAGTSKTPENAPKRVAVLDAADQIAVAKVTAWWGIDYLHMAKFDGKWQIIHVIWQSK